MRSSSIHYRSFVREMMMLSILLAPTRQTSVSAFLPKALVSTELRNKARSHGLWVTVSDWTFRSRGMATSSQASEETLVLDPLIVCGPSGVGKGTIIERFMSDEFGGNRYFGFSTSHTTRAPREGEIDKVHYNFVNLEDMQQLIKRGKFLEYAQVHNNYYGTSFDALKKIHLLGKRCLLDIDVQGVKRIKALVGRQQQHQHLRHPLHQREDNVPTETTANGESSIILKPKYIFIAPPCMDVLEKRLIGRGTESEESLKRRTQNARDEVTYGLQERNFDRVITNDNLDQACRDFSQAVSELYDL